MAFDLFNNYFVKSFSTKGKIFIIDTNNFPTLNGLLYYLKVHIIANTL